MEDKNKERVTWCRECVYCNKCPCAYEYGCSTCRSTRERKEISTTCKPTIGIKPKWAYEHDRIREILKAMKRYIDANVPVPKSWVEELEERIEKEFSGNKF